MKTWNDIVESFNDFLDETTDPVVILGISYSPSKVLKETDPIAYKCGLVDYIVSLDI